MVRYFWLGLLVVMLFAGCQSEQLGTGAAVAVIPPPAKEPAKEIPTTLPLLILEEVRILGSAGFDPSELTISVGDQVVFTNADSREKATVLTFQKDGTQQFINSESIQPGGTWTYAFEELGAYEYWTIGYGVKGRIVVE